jgi:hypothetical protein
VRVKTVLRKLLGLCRAVVAVFSFTPSTGGVGRDLCGLHAWETSAERSNCARGHADACDPRHHGRGRCGVISTHRYARRLSSVT